MYPLLKWNVVLVKQYEKSYIYNLSRKENGIIVSSHFMYEIINKDGEIVSILPPCLLEGNVLKTLNSISEIGNDLEFKFAKCVKDGQELDVSYGCPTIKLESQQIFF